MKVIKINENMFVPAHNIDVVFIEKKPEILIVRTVGGFTIESTYSNKDVCKKEYERIFNSLEK